MSSSAVTLPVAMLVVFGAAKLSAEIFERLNQPGIVGEILAGVLIGPHALGWIEPNELLTALAELGVMFLLFRVGLEVKSSELMSVGAVAALVAGLGVVMPFAMGWALLLVWGEQQTTAIFVGAAMVATSVGITAQVLSSHGWLSTRAGQVILAAAVIDDVLGLIILALVSSMARGDVNLLELVLTAGLATGFTFIAAKWGHRAAVHFVSRLESKLRLGEGSFALAMVVLFGLSALATYAGVAAIIGAFLAGMMLAEGIGSRVRDLAHGVTELLVPFFLVGVGLHFDWSAIGDRSSAPLAVLVLIMAIISKLVGCGLGAFSLGYADAVRVGFGMVPRGEVGIVVAQLGLQMGIVSAAVYGIVVLMSIGTTLVAPPMLKFAFRDKSL